MLKSILILLLSEDQCFSAWINKKFQRKIVNIFLPIIFRICFGAQKNHLIDMVLLSTHNICFG